MLVFTLTFAWLAASSHNFPAKESKWSKEVIHIKHDCDDSHEICGSAMWRSPRRHDAVTVVAKPEDPSQQICIAALPHDWERAQMTRSCGVGEVSLCVDTKTYPHIRVFCDDETENGNCGEHHKTIKFKVKYEMAKACELPKCEDSEEFEFICSSNMIEFACQSSVGVQRVCRATCARLGHTSTLCQINETECLRQRALAQSKFVVGRYVPQCEEDGSFRPLQCHGSTGYCWCVDEHNNKLSGTEKAPGGGIVTCGNEGTLPSSSSSPSTTDDGAPSASSPPHTPANTGTPNTPQGLPVIAHMKIVTTSHQLLEDSVIWGALMIVGVAVLIALAARHARRRSLASQDDTHAILS